mgnify:CR=1 FL=1
MGQLRQNFVLQSEAGNEIYAGSFWISVFVAGVISNAGPCPGQPPRRVISGIKNKKVVDFRGFGVPTARPEGGKGRTGLGWVWNGHFRPPWGWLLGDFFVP